MTHALIIESPESAFIRPSLGHTNFGHEELSFSLEEEFFRIHKLFFNAVLQLLSSPSLSEFFGVETISKFWHSHR